MVKKERTYHKQNTFVWIFFIVSVIIMGGSLLYAINKASEGASALASQAYQRGVGVVDGVVLETSHGDITINLFEEAAPKTVENFVTLAREDFYDGTRFHRVIPDFMIQGGDPLSKDVSQKARWGSGGPGYTFADEINDYKLVQGRVAMANRGPDTNGSQFFIVTAEHTSWLDGVHTVFGEVTGGMNVVMEIQRVPTDNRDRPTRDVVIEDVILR